MPTTAAVIHQYEKKLEQEKTRIQIRKTITEDDKKLILSFIDILLSQGMSIGRVSKYANHMKILSEKMVEETNNSERGLSQATKEDMRKLAIWIDTKSNYTANTRSDCKKVLKRFYQWLLAPPEEYETWRDERVYPDIVRGLKTNVKANERFLPEDLLSDEDVAKLIGVANNIMQEASHSFDDEVGPRPGEKLGMKIRDIVFDGKNVIARLRGKTGERRILLVKCVSKLSQWLNSHPLKDDRDAPLWVSLSNNNKLEAWSYAAYLKFLRESAERAGIQKKIIPYTFRHSAATRDAKLGFNEVMLCKKYGWTLGSKMPQVYLHLSSSDLFAKIAQTYGGEEAEKPKPQTLGCVRCGRGNHPSQKLCGWCGSPLHDEDIAKHSIELEENKQSDNRKIEELASQITEMQERLNTLVRMSK